MASTYTTDLAIQLMATGENAGTWGAITNTNLVVVQQAIAGYQGISIAGGAQTTALVMTQNALATARNAVIKLTGTITGNQIVTVPNGIEKTWIVSNGTSGAFTVQFKYASTGSGQTWSTTDKGIKILYADGTDIQVADLSTLSGTLANFSVATAQLATNAVTAVKITQSTITQAKLASNSVGEAQIINSTITQSKLAANSVGSNQLVATAVTPGAYTSASITVDSDGRITAASSGSAGAGGFVPTLFSVGPASGTYTASPTANRLGVFMYAGGGGAGGFIPDRGNAPGMGGSGGYGYYNFPISSQPFSQPYSVGAPGAGGAAGNPFPTGFGTSGGNTNLTNVGTVNAGNGGDGVNWNNNGTPGNNGTAPGASFIPSSRSFMVGNFYSIGSPLAYFNPSPMTNNVQNQNLTSYGQAGQSTGGPGLLVIFENTGT